MLVWLLVFLEEAGTTRGNNQIDTNGDFDTSQLDPEGLCLGYQEIDLLFNVGPYPGGGDCLIVEANGELIQVNSCDVVHDLNAYTLEQVPEGKQASVTPTAECDEDDPRAEYVGYLVLMELFDADPDKWIRHLKEQGTDDEPHADLPFALWVKEQAEQDPDLLNRVRRMIGRTKDEFYASKIQG